MTAGRRRQLRVDGAVGDQQPMTRRLLRTVVAESRRVEDGGRDEDDQYSNARASRSDVAASVQRVTNSDVATERHVHCQPRAAQLERVDETLP